LRGARRTLAAIVDARLDEALQVDDADTLKTLLCSIENFVSKDSAKMIKARLRLRQLKEPPRNETQHRAPPKTDEARIDIGALEPDICSRADSRQTACSQAASRQTPCSRSSSRQMPGSRSSSRQRPQQSNCDGDIDSHSLFQRLVHASDGSRRRSNSEGRAVSPSRRLKSPSRVMPQVIGRGHSPRRLEAGGDTKDEMSVHCRGLSFKPVAGDFDQTVPVQGSSCSVQ